MVTVVRISIDLWEQTDKGRQGQQPSHDALIISEECEILTTYEWCA